jgi:hypothetical protein
MYVWVTDSVVESIDSTVPAEKGVRLTAHEREERERPKKYSISASMGDVDTLPSTVVAANESCNQ